MMGRKRTTIHSEIAVVQSVADVSSSVVVVLNDILPTTNSYTTGSKPIVFVTNGGLFRLDMYGDVRLGTITFPQ